MAASANLAASVNLATSVAQLSWVDTFPVGSTYAIQSVDAGVATTISTQAASSTGNTLSWQQNIATTTTYQVIATVGGQVFSLQTSQGQSSVMATVPTAAPAIVVTPGTATLSGVVTLSLDNNFSYPSVTWFVDTTQIGTATGAGAPLQWATTGTTNGQHLILAVISLSPGSTLTVRKQVGISNSNLVVNASNSGTSGTVYLNVTASSNFAITSVTGSVDGQSLGVLTAPNACYKYCSANDLYQFTIDALKVGSGAHTFLATAVDASGSAKTVSLSFSVSNPPVLVLSSPLDGAFINGADALNIAGSASSDKAGGVTVTAFLGSLPITVSQSTGAAFAGSFSLAGLPAGPYTLTVNAKDSAGVTTTSQVAIIVSSSAATSYVPSFTMGINGQLIAVDNSNASLILYRAGDGTYRVRNTSTNVETILQGASSIPYLYNWAMDGGYVFLEGGWVGLTTAGYTDCPGDCIFQWTPAGVRSNISNPSPYSTSSYLGGAYGYEQFPRAHGGYVIWVDFAGPNPGSYTMYNVATRAYTQIKPPGGVNYPGNNSYDFAVVNGVVNFFYWGQTGGTGTASSFDVYQWASSSNSSTLLSSTGLRSIYPQTDGIRAAWSQAPTSAAVGGLSSLVYRPVSGGVSATLSSGMINFKVAGGVVAWVEGVAGTNSQGIQTTTITGLKALTPAGVTTTVTPAPTAVLYGAGNGMVVYAAQNKTYSWSSLNPQSSSLLIDSTPAQVLVSGSTMYFTQGASQAVYKIALQ